MKFVIIGDSWGVGEWTNREFQEPILNSGLDYHLTQLGHTVVNYAQGSAGNFGQLRHLYWSLKENSDYDYILWFHTESFRDIQQIIIDEPEEGQLYFPNFDINNWTDSLHYINQVNYNYAQQIYNEFNVPFIIVGGQAPVDPIIGDYTFAHIKINSWLAELLELEFDIPMYTIGSWHKIEKILTHYNVNLTKFIAEHAETLDAMTRIEDRAKQSVLFPDNGHPSKLCFELLAKQLTKTL